MRSTLVYAQVGGGAWVSAAGGAVHPCAGAPLMLGDVLDEVNPPKQEKTKDSEDLGLCGCLSGISG